MAGEDRRIIFLAAERAAGFSLDHAHLVVRQIEYTAQRLEHVVGTLQRAPHRDSVFCAVLGNDALVLDIEMFLRAGAIFPFDNMRGAGPRGVYVALFQQKTLEQIVCAPHDLLLPLTLLDGEDGRQWFVLDIHRAERFAQLVLIGMREKKDRLLAMIHLAVGEARLIGNDELNNVFAGNVGGGDDGEFAPVDTAVEGDGADEAAGNGAAHRGSIPHALAFHVVDVAGAAHQLVHALFSGNGGANDAGCRMRAHGCRQCRTG